MNSLPGDPHVGHLLVDLGFPALVDAADLRAPQESRIASTTPFMNFGNSSNCVHRLDGPHRDLDVDGLLDRGHDSSFGRFSSTGSKFDAGKRGENDARSTRRTRSFAESTAPHVHILRTDPP
jgi:hypothetical protein